MERLHVPRVKKRFSIDSSTDIDGIRARATPEDTHTARVIRFDEEHRGNDQKIDARCLLSVTLFTKDPVNRSVKELQCSR